MRVGRSPAPGPPARALAAGETPALRGRHLGRGGGSRQRCSRRSQRRSLSDFPPPEFWTGPRPAHPRGPFAYPRLGLPKNDGKSAPCSGAVHRLDVPGVLLRRSPSNRVPTARHCVATCFAASLAVTAITRWPLSWSTTALSLDTNTTLHELVVHDLVRYRDFSAIHSLGSPDPIRVRIVAVPVVLLAASVAPWLGERAAFRLAVNGWYTLQGFAVGLLALALEWDGMACVSATVAALFAPYLLLPARTDSPRTWPSLRSPS